MIKRSVINVLALMICTLIFVSCGIAQITVPESDAETSESATVIYQTVLDDPETSDTDNDDLELSSGIWWGVGDSDDSYYLLDSDGSGIVISQSSGTESNFEYELDGDEILFRIDDSINTTPAQIEFINSDYLIIDYSNGDREEWTYLGELTFEDFTFYSSDELCLMARDYLRSENGSEPQYTNAYITESGLIAIHLYDIVDDHTSTCQWYTVDRFTAQGTDFFDEPVDLTTIL